VTRPQSTSSAEDRAMALLARTATEYVADMAMEGSSQSGSVNEADGNRRLARALDRIENILVFFIQRSGGNEDYMKVRIFTST
jgi:hypothetical protein